MIPATALHYAFLQQADVTDSQYIGQLSIAQRDYYLNRSKDLIIETYSKLAENNSKIAGYLLDITVRDKKLTAKLENDYFLSSYPKDYYFPLGIYVDARKKDCEGVRRFPVRRLTSDKIRRALKNANVKRFWDFEETVSVQSNKGFQVYTEPDVTYEVFLDYIKKVPDIATPQFEGAERYIDSAGKPVTQNKDLEINDIDLFHKIVSVAVLLVKRDKRLIQDYELQFKTLLNLDKI